MPAHVLLLRAVNVGGTGKLAMADLRTLLAGLGYTRVETYIQSGNAVFDAPGTAVAVGKAVAAALAAHTGAAVDVIMRSHAGLSRVIAENPFSEEAAADGARVHVVFLAAKAPPSARAILERVVTSYPRRRDRFHLAGDTLYLYLPDGAGESKFGGKQADIGVKGTARNWNTALKLHAMSKR